MMYIPVGEVFTFKSDAPLKSDSGRAFFLNSVDLPLNPYYDTAV